jgi:hypothetical protein
MRAFLSRGDGPVVYPVASGLALSFTSGWLFLRTLAGRSTSISKTYFPRRDSSIRWSIDMSDSTFPRQYD